MSLEEALVSKQVSDLVEELKTLRRERGKLKGGHVTMTCANVLQAIATLTKTLVDLEFTVLDIKNREQNLSVVSSLVEKRKLADDDAAVNEPSAKINTPPEPGCYNTAPETACVR